ncbi:hypothetical protein OIU77_017542 [Salix suchowensis]|uniref:Uncharacterized protein n=1 Tax=Salix suchowensis TaxID=1278906 RepID=A0ABQ8ZPP8_9ROSI|nr:hypothetical protein OIU77_017542 [Salix suchowensis]
MWKVKSCFTLGVRSLIEPIFHSVCQIRFSRKGVWIESHGDKVIPYFHLPLDNPAGR